MASGILTSKDDRVSSDSFSLPPRMEELWPWVVQMKVGNEVRQAYQCSDLFAKRLKLMRQWADHLGYEEQGGKIIQIGGEAQ